MSTIEEFAPAKINLSLNVGARGKDGYHSLESLVVFADIGDRLTFEYASEIALHCYGPFGEGLSADEENLVLRAAHALQRATEETKGARISLYKTLPISSGIGGGSADAAATLRGLNRLWGCGLSACDLEDIAVDLGADVPVCVQNQTRYMRGRGEILDTISGWPILDAVLVNPGVSVSTKSVFSRFDALGKSGTFTNLAFMAASNKNDAIAQLATGSNNLTSAACIEAPVIGKLLNELSQHPQTQLVRLCGSGATCVAVTISAQKAKNLAATIQSIYPHYWVQTVQIGIS